MKKHKYIHYVSYLSNGNRIGVGEILSNCSKIDTKTKVDDLKRIISEIDTSMTNIAVTNIFTIKNK